jgi:hypothetical protein
MRPSETLIEFFNRFEDALRNHVLLHGRDKVTTGLGTKESYLNNALMTDSYNGYKEFREHLVKTDLNVGRNQKLK